MKQLACAAGFLWASAILAQQSATYQIESASFNNGGRPAQGVVAESASYQLSLDSIGDAVLGTGLTSAGLSLAGGFVGSFPPAGEVANLRFTNASTLRWDPDPSTGDYALYRGMVAAPFDPAYGACAQPPPAIVAPTATVASVPGPNHAFFYLVTARNRLAEEGTKGSSSAGGRRPNPAPCP